MHYVYGQALCCVVLEVEAGSQEEALVIARTADVGDIDVLHLHEEGFQIKFAKKVPDGGKNDGA